MLRTGIAPNIGKLKLEKLTALDLRKFYDQTKKGGRVEQYEGMKDKSLSARTVRGLHATLRIALDQAVKERLIPYDPAIGRCLPPKETKRCRSFRRRRSVRTSARRRSMAPCPCPA